MKTPNLILAMLSVSCLVTLADTTNAPATDPVLTAPKPALASKPAWTGASRGMELVSVGRKKVTILTADGQSVVIAVPILVERPIGSKTPTFKSKPAL